MDKVKEKIMIQLEKESNGERAMFLEKVAKRTLREKEGKYKNHPYWKLPDNSEYVFKGGELVKKAKKKE